MKLGWGTHLNEILSQKELVEDFLEDKLGCLDERPSEAEQQVLLWCIENYVPLKTLESGDAYIVGYEKFCARPYEEAEHLFRWLGRTLDERVEEVFDLPSKTVRRESAVVAGENRVNGWQRDLSADVRRRALQVVSMFELDRYYDEDPLPKTDFAFDTKGS
jgi:hypothetical protein